VSYVGAVPVVAGVASLVVTGVAVCFAGAALGSAWSTLLGLVVMVALVLLLLLRCVRRLGGITGDVLGAAVEASLAVLLLAAATA
jgi:adenosylcobinamide-GDP ribazoletransferase